MCTYSMIVDHKYDEWHRRQQQDAEERFRQSWQPLIGSGSTAVGLTFNPVTQAEIDEFRRLLDRAREYDKKNNEPDCEMEEKKTKLKALADALGIDISFMDEKGGK